MIVSTLDKISSTAIENYFSSPNPKEIKLALNTLQLPSSLVQSIKEEVTLKERNDLESIFTQQEMNIAHQIQQLDEQTLKDELSSILKQIKEAQEKINNLYSDFENNPERFRSSILENGLYQDVVAYEVEQLLNYCRHRTDPSFHDKLQLEIKSTFQHSVYGWFAMKGTKHAIPTLTGHIILAEKITQQQKWMNQLASKKNELTSLLALPSLHEKMLSLSIDSSLSNHTTEILYSLLDNAHKEEYDDVIKANDQHVNKVLTDEVFFEQFLNGAKLIANDGNIHQQIQSLYSKKQGLINTKLEIQEALRDRITTIQADSSFFSKKDKIARLESLYKHISDINIQYNTPLTIFSDTLLAWKSQKLNGKENGAVMAEDRGLFAWLRSLFAGKKKTESSKMLENISDVAKKNVRSFFQANNSVQTSEDSLSDKPVATPRGKL